MHVSYHPYYSKLGRLGHFPKMAMDTFEGGQEKWLKNPRWPRNKT